MTQSLILAIDQGGQSTRMGLYDLHGNRLFITQIACATQHVSRTGYVAIEQDPKEILGSFEQGFTQVSQFLRESGFNLLAAGYSGQGSSLICWDRKTGEALSPVISWQDVRGKTLIDDLEVQYPDLSERLMADTGLRASPHYGASKYRWCLEQLPQVRNAADQQRLLMGPLVCFFMQHYLTIPAGQPLLVDPGHAQRTLLWNRHTNQWDHSLMRLFGLDSKSFSSITYHNANFGIIDRLHCHCSVMAVARDQGASLFSGGLPNTDTIYVNVGTGAFIQRVTHELTPPNGQLVSPLWITPDAQTNLYAWEATVNGAASAIPYVSQQAGIVVSATEIDEALTKTLADSEEKLFWFLNAQGELSAPWWKTGLQSQWSEGLTAKEKILAWLESVLFQITLNIQLMAASAPVARIICSGGFSQCDGFCQALANLTGCVVERTDDTEASLTGIAFLAANKPTSWKMNKQMVCFTPQASVGLGNRFRCWKKQVEMCINQ